MTKKAKAKDTYLRKKYGITLAEYEQKLADQDDSCALCRKHKSNFKRSLAVDHNHKTGRVRGLVCFYCNSQLIRKHNADTVERLVVYFRTFDPKVSK